MKFKILFVVFVVVLLSASVIADEPKVKVSHADKRRAKISEVESHTSKGLMYIAPAFAGPLAAAVNIKSISKGLEHFEKAKAGKAQLERMRTNIYARGWYSVYDVIDAYEDYSGINQYSALFFGEEWLAKRRKM
ncbi:hypothetical protein GF343_04235, partial [Candidatus Woesearchaeota archaeon]|nr:hypothetical protein [Candidatus Woesearchaeota archaeon]